MKISLTVNGTRQTASVDGPESLLFLLRERLGLPGSKNACEQGECGSCSVILDGDLVCSCLVMAADAHESQVDTIEGLVPLEGNELHPLQEVILQAGGVQCGFCTPGIVMAAWDLFERNPAPSEADIREALAGNICRCTGYGAIVRALTGYAGGSL